MTVKQLIDKLKDMDQDKVVILSEPDGIGWDNVGLISDDGTLVKIHMDGNGLFQDS